MADRSFIVVKLPVTKAILKLPTIIQWVRYGEVITSVTRWAS